MTFYDQLQEDVHNNMTNKYNKLKHKLDGLTKDQRTNSNKTTRQFHARLVNLTKTNFTTTETELLNKGLKHNLHTNSTKDFEQLVIDTEMAITKLPTDEQEHARHTTADIIKKLKDKSTNGLTTEQLTEIKTAKQLRKKLSDNDLVVTKTDKGNATVIITKTDYNHKTMTFINNNGYNKLAKDPTDKFQTEIRRAINNSKLVIPSRTSFRLTNMNPRAPSLKALPKVHKKDIPIRPVVNYRPAPSYKLSKFLAELIKNKVDLEDNFTIKNSLEIANKLNNLSISPTSRLLSFDITNLYTSIPVDETLDILYGRLLLNHDKQYSKQLTDLTKTVLTQNYFHFDGKHFIATDGLGMGHPASAILSEVFMQSLEDLYVPRLIEEFGVTSYNRYVDDSFLIVDNRHTDNTDDILTYLNSIHPNIRFTVEQETDNKLNFLDLTVTRTNNGLDIDVYRKPTATDHTIHSTSNHPNQHKLAAYRHMIHRLQTLPLTTDNYNKELNTIYDIAHTNGYKKRTIDRLLTNYRNTKTDKRTEEDCNKQWTGFTYIGKDTYKLTNYFRKHNLLTSFRTNNNMKDRLRTDSRQLPLNNSGVYQLTCGDCEHTYIGQTGRKLRDRYREHFRSFIQGKTDSNYADHLLTHGHDPTTIDVGMTLLRPGTKGRRLDIQEKLEIYKRTNTLGRLMNEQIHSPTDVLFTALIPRAKRKRDENTDGPNKRHHTDDRHT